MADHFSRSLSRPTPGSNHAIGIVSANSDMLALTAGRTYTFTLREGVTFHNGRELVAEDVKYSLERTLNPETRSPGQGFFLIISGAQDFIDGAASEVAGIRADDLLDLLGIDISPARLKCAMLSHDSLQHVLADLGATPAATEAGA